MAKTAMMVGALVFAGLACTTSDASAQSPFGLHIGGRAAHIDIGNPHGGYRSYNNFYRAPVSRGHYDWHDTSHLHYHRPQIVQHGNHYDRTPGHYDVHRTGHFDYHRPNYNRGYSRRW